jgi:putative peptidoglycan lipid II flippase
MTVNPSALPDPASTASNAAPASSSSAEQKRKQDETNASVAGATGILALGNIVSRVLGLVRETVLSFLFGASAAVDAFQVAIIVPKAVYDLLIGGHLNGAIVPVLSEVVSAQGRTALWHLVSILMSVVTVFMALIVLCIQLFAPQIAILAASGADAQTLGLAADMLRITSPALLFLGLFAIFSGALYALRSFTWPAFAGALFNGSIVLVTLLLAPPLQAFLQPQLDLAQPISIGRPAEGVVVTALGWFVGALVQMGLQWIGLRHARLRLTLNWRHPALRRIGLLYLPVMFSLIMDTLIIRFFSYNLASQTGEASIAYMNWATTLIQFPQGLVATAISVAILPTLARQATLTATEGLQAFRDTLGLGLRLATVLIIPATMALFVLAVPIVALIFEHGAFTADDTLITAQALRLYLVGLPFAALDLLLVYAFYARKDTLTPALIGLFSHLVYILAVILLIDRFGLFSLMIADSLKHIVHALVSAALLARKINGFGEQRYLATTLKTLLAASAMACVGWLLIDPFTQWIGNQGIIREALLVLSLSVAAGSVYLGMAALLRLQELRWVVGLIWQRVRRS